VFPHGFAIFNTMFGDMAVNSYLVWDSRARTAAAFDTGADCGGMLGPHPHGEAEASR
jgi:hydroxyacylglutathione hydrolase